MARVYTPTDESVARLQSLDLDVTESGGDGYVDVVLNGAGDAAALSRYGLAYRVLTHDLVAQDTRFRAQDEAYARSITTSGLPSGRTRYRRLFNYSEEMKDLARRYPNLVRYFQLQEQTYEGRPVEGIEITERRAAPATASPSSCSWACTTPGSGPRVSTRWSGPTA